MIVPADDLNTIDWKKQNAMRGNVDMTLDEFRLKHSELIEHYQFIEYHLECLFSSLQEKKTFLDGIQDVERDNIRRLISKICMLQDALNVSALTEEDCEKLKRISDERNIWCHNCYVDMVFDRNTGGLKKDQDIKRMEADLLEARQMRDYLFEKKLPYQYKKDGMSRVRHEQINLLDGFSFKS